MPSLPNKPNMKHIPLLLLLSSVLAFAGANNPASGPTGPTGTTGTNGTNGTPGSNGTNGIQGPVGPSPSPTPYDFYGGPYMDIDIAKQGFTNGQTITAGTVLTDSSGNGHTMTVTGVSMTYVANAINGRPALLIPSTTSNRSYLNSTWSVDSTFDTALTVVCVVQQVVINTQFNQMPIFGTSEGNFSAICKNLGPSGSLCLTTQTTASGTKGDSPGRFPSTNQPILLILSYNGTIKREFVNGGETAETTGGSVVGSTGTFCVGSFINTGGNPAGTSSEYVSEILVYKHGFVAMDGVQASPFWLNKFRFPLVDYVWMGGDSQMASNGASTADSGLAQIFMSIMNKGQAGFLIQNTATGGATTVVTNPLLTNYSSGIQPYASNKVAYYWNSSNEYASTPAVVATNYFLGCDILRRAGNRVVAFTDLPKSSGETNRVTLNNLIRAGWTNRADCLIDVAADPNFGIAGANTNTAYYAADANHLNSTSLTNVANLMANAWNNVTHSSSTANFTLHTIAGVLSGGTATITLPAGIINPWVQDTASSLTNVGTLQVTVSGTTATVTSSNVLDVSTFNLYYWQ